jgi:hypothetical protein
MRWVVVVAIVALACGGKSEKHGGESRDEDPGLDSQEVFDDGRAFPDVPDDSVLIHARGDPRGLMDEKGRSGRWILNLVSPSEGSVWTVEFFDNRVQVGPWEVELVDCFAALPIPDAPGSNVLVPEMEERYAPFDPFPETKARWTSRSYDVTHPCMGPHAYSRVSASRSNPETGETISFHYDYSWEGAPLRACEGCAASGYCCD